MTPDQQLRLVGMLEIVERALTRELSDEARRHLRALAAEIKAELAARGDGKKAA